LVRRAAAENDQALADLKRLQKLFEQQITSKESLERASNLAASTSNQLDAAKSRAQSAAYQVQEAESALLEANANHPELPFAIKSPANGRVLRLLEQSERVLATGTPILEIGYTPKLEAVADFLTKDAVKVNPGMDALIEDWGGDKPLRARVRTVEPGAFTKISALGVEEQRTNVVLDFVDPPEKLADAYRVEVRIITWQGQSVLKVPLSAVFRSGTEWEVFMIENSKAHTRAVQLGHRGSLETEILNGLTAGDLVVTYPTNETKEGVHVRLSNASP
jgi:HlyD family secretion protein